MLATFAVAGSVSPVFADRGEGHEHVLPERNDAANVRASTWRSGKDWAVAPEHRPREPGYRVAALFEVNAGGSAITMEARGVEGDERGPWRALDETFRGDAGARVAVVDLDQAWPAAELRVAADHEDRVGDLMWELLEPRYPDAGANARAAADEVAQRADRSVDPELAELGVVSRAEWGARPTQCTAPEHDWYRMAIHHTAGAQTSGGTVAGAVEALQAFSQDSGGFCDVPYQFLVGYDGSLYEGRPLSLRSGATGGNNDGNMAVSFLGCYHPSDCPGASHNVTDAMMREAARLIHTAAEIHEIPQTDERIRGHRDYGNPTVCPGDYLHPRLGELRDEGPAPYAAELVDRSWEVSGSALELGPGEPAEVWVEFENRGASAWEPGVTFLAPTEPRDAASVLAHDSWHAPDRAATVANTVPPGDSAQFSFSIAVDAEAAEGAGGELEERFGLVQQDVTWFADEPLGGGPGDAAVTVRARMAQEGGGHAGGSDGDGDGGGASVTGGCRLGGSSSPSAPAAVAVLAALGLVRRAYRS